MDRREIQNIMGKYVYAVLLKEESKLVDTYWADLPDISLGVNNGYYVGQDAVRGYYAAIDENTKIRSEYMLKVLPKYFDGKTEKDVHGVGSLEVDGLSNAVIEQAEDGKTIKALWHVAGCDTNIHPEGPYSYWAYGYIAADFILIDDEWKIWHLQNIIDLGAPVGVDFAKPGADKVEPLPEFAALADQLKPLPEPTVKKAIHDEYKPGRGFQPFAKVPEPYVTFADTFSYGI
jgi:hypothetical protein